MTRRRLNRKIVNGAIFFLVISNLCLGGIVYEQSKQVESMSAYVNCMNQVNNDLCNTVEELNINLAQELQHNEEMCEVLQEKDKSIKESKEYNNSRFIKCNVTAYTEGDDFTPSRTMANGEKVHVGAVASYDLPLGTKVRINGNIYTVKDRCGIPNTIDIYMNSKQECLSFGKKYMEVEIL